MKAQIEQMKHEFILAGMEQRRQDLTDYVLQFAWFSYDDSVTEKNIKLSALEDAIEVEGLHFKRRFDELKCLEILMKGYPTEYSADDMKTLKKIFLKLKPHFEKKLMVWWNGEHTWGEGIREEYIARYGSFYKGLK